MTLIPKKIQRCTAGVCRGRHSSCNPPPRLLWYVWHLSTVWKSHWVPNPRQDASSEVLVSVTGRPTQGFPMHPSSACSLPSEPCNSNSRDGVSEKTYISKCLLANKTHWRRLIWRTSCSPYMHVTVKCGKKCIFRNWVKFLPIFLPIILLFLQNWSTKISLMPPDR